MKRLAWALLLLLALVAAPANATVFFDQNFETATPPFTPPTTEQQFGGWTIRRNTYPDGIEHCQFTTEQAHSGRISVRLDYTNCCANNNMDACDVSLVSDFPHVSEIWVRAWFYGVNYGTSTPGEPCIDNPSVNCGNGHAKRMYFHMFSPSGISTLPSFVPENYGLNTPDVGIGAYSQDCFPSSGYSGTGDVLPYCNNDPNRVGGLELYSYLAPNFVANNVWQCFEYHFRLNTVVGGVAQKNALVESWINGTLAMSVGNIAIRNDVSSPNNGSADILFGPFNPGIYRQSAKRGGILYVDDVAIGDQRIGCGAAQNQPTAPVAPCCMTISKLLTYWFLRLAPWLGVFA
jgi:hypothetical protein